MRIARRIRNFLLLQAWLEPCKSISALSKMWHFIYYLKVCISPCLNTTTTYLSDVALWILLLWISLAAWLSYALMQPPTMQTMSSCTTSKPHIHSLHSVIDGLCSMWSLRITNYVILLPKNHHQQRNNQSNGTLLVSAKLRYSTESSISHNNATFTSVRKPQPHKFLKFFKFILLAPYSLPLTIYATYSQFIG